MRTPAPPGAPLPEGSERCPHCKGVIVLSEQCSIVISAPRAIGEELEKMGQPVVIPVLSSGLLCEHCSKPIWSGPAPSVVF